LAKVLTWSGLLADFGERRPGGLEADLAQADQRQRQAIAIGMEIGDQLVTAYARSQRGLTLLLQSLSGAVVDRGEMIALTDSAITALIQHGDHFGAGETTLMQAVELLSIGDVEGCALAAESARDHAERCGDRFVRSRVEWIEGLLADAAGETALAYRHIERSLQLLDEFGAGHEVTAQAGLLIRLADRLGERQLASQWRAFVAGRTGDRTPRKQLSPGGDDRLGPLDVLLEASMRNHAGLQASQAGDLHRALAFHTEALAGYVGAGVLGGIAFTESCLAVVTAAMGEGLAADTHHATAQRVAARAGVEIARRLALEAAAGSRRTTVDPAKLPRAAVAQDGDTASQFAQ
jgi:hypothetical protein